MIKCLNIITLSLDFRVNLIVHNVSWILRSSVLQNFVVGVLSSRLMKSHAIIITLEHFKLIVRVVRDIYTANIII